MMMSMTTVMMMMMRSLRNNFTVDKETCLSSTFSPTKFGKHFPGKLLVGLMAEEGKGCPVKMT